MPFASGDGAEIYYEVHGRGTPIVFSAGMGGSGSFWAPQVAAMAEPGMARRIRNKVRKQVCARRTTVTNTLPIEKIRGGKIVSESLPLKMNPIALFQLIEQTAGS